MLAWPPRRHQPSRCSAGDSTRLQCKHCGNEQGGCVSGWFPTQGLCVALIWVLSLLRWFSSQCLPSPQAFTGTDAGSGFLPAHAGPGGLRW